MKFWDTLQIDTANRRPLMLENLIWDCPTVLGTASFYEIIVESSIQHIATISNEKF